MSSFTTENADRKTFIVDIPVYFSEKGELWGTFRFYLLDKPYRDAKFNLQIFLVLSFSTAIASIICIIIGINYLYVKTLKELLDNLKDQIEGRQFKVSAFLQYIFEPFITISSKIANEVLSNRRKAEEAEANRLFNKMALSIAHDIQAPLSSLKASVSILSEKPSIAKGLIEKCISRISSMSEEMLERARTKNVLVPKDPPFKKIDSSNANVQNDCFPISESIKDVIDEKSIILSQSKSKIRLNYYDETVGLNISGDKVLFQRTISNIIQNSIEAISDGGFISISTIHITPLVIVEVRDNGIGISSENLEILRNSPRSIGKTKGNGLGLSCAYEYLEQNDGSLEIDSRLGEGTVIKLKLHNPLAHR